MSTRQSARISARTRTGAVQSRESPGSSSIPENSQKQASKRQKIASTPGLGVSIQRDKKGKGRAEFLYCLTQMPLDILLGIFSLLEPIDLNHLLRVSKAFHEFLWLETSAPIWHMAYENLPYPQCPPPCPHGVHIIHYTNFLFGIHCQFCASTSIPQVQHDTGLVRLCSRCVKKHAIGPQDKVDEGVLRLCHAFECSYYLKVEYILRQKEVAQATGKTLSKYLEQRQMALNYRSQQASGLVVWRDQLTIHANAELVRIHMQRRQEIQNRLSREACVPQHLLWQLYGVNFPQAMESHELNNDEWRNIRADIIEFLFDISENQVRNSTKQALTAGIRALDAILQQFVITRPRIAPTAFHIASSNPYFQMIKSSVTFEQTVNVVLEHISKLPEFITRWRLNTDSFLAGLIPRHQQNMDDDPSLPLGLATSFFRCDMCSEPISYPRVLMHHCFLRPTKAILGSNKKPVQRKKNVPRDPRQLQLITADIVFPSLSYTFGEGMHPDRAGVAFHRMASKSARMIILGCRENPDIITYGEMDLKDFRVECLLCSSAERGRLVMRWTIAILHDLAKHSKMSSQTHWQLVDSVEDEEKIKAKETEMVNKSDMPALYCCRLCDEKVMKNLVALHLVDSHEFTENEDNVSQHFYPDIDLTMAIPPLAIRI